jgi:hypothetical protein
MTNIYYTAREGRRNRYGHTTTRGEVYAIKRGEGTNADALELVGEYTHQSGGAGIELAILTVCERAGIDTNGGYYGGKYRATVTLTEI